ncbi:hypothetical protein D3Z55_22525 [Clostridiaceae bacterium]|nr:hypothetical protein [Lachnospiraceae bacterium]NBH20089.1 hypothetical protein [Clostridiaceae bacterium]
MELLLITIYMGLNLLDFKKYRFYNTINVTIGAYVVITVLNNVLATHFGFYKVGVKVQFVILVAMVLIYMSALIRRQIKAHGKVLVCRTIQSNDGIEEIFQNKRKVRIIAAYFILCCLARAIQICCTIKVYGMDYLGQCDFEQLNLSGIPSHLFLSVYPVAGFIFYYAIKKKSFWSFVLYLSGLGISFLSFIKYNAIFYVIFTFVFCVILDSKLGKRLVILLGTTIVAIFIGNYILGFALRNITKFGMANYLSRLWDYVGGSMINGNHCIHFFESEVGYSAVDILISSFFPLISIVSAKLFHHTIVSPVFPMGIQMLSDIGNTSNVAGLLFNVSYTGSMLLFIGFCLMEGWIVEGILKKVRMKQYQSNLFFYSMVLTIAIMTFFANYFTLSTIWELLVWSYLIPKVLIFSRFCI